MNTKLLVVVVSCLALVACDSGGSSNEPVVANDTDITDEAATLPDQNTPSDDEEPTGQVASPDGNIASNTTQPVINRENYVAIARQAFEVFSGKAYDNRLNQFSYETNPALCENAGATSQSPNELNYEQCLIGADTVDGSVIQTVGEQGINRTFSGFSVSFEPAGSMQLDGQHHIACCSPTDSFSTDNFNYLFSYSAGTLTVSDATTNQIVGPVSGHMSGNFSMIPPMAMEHRIEVSVTNDFSYDYGGNLSAEELEQVRTGWTFHNGTMILIADDGSELKLDADTGDRATIAITLNNSAGDETHVDAWNQWAAATRWSPGSQLGTFNRANSMDILAKVFASYTGEQYAEALFPMPNYSDSQYMTRPVSPELYVSASDRTGEAINVACTDGGNAVFTPIYAYEYRSTGPYFSDYGWVYRFDNCKDGENLLSGSMSTEERMSSNYSLESDDGFTTTSSTTQIEFSGGVYYSPGNSWGCHDCEGLATDNFNLTAIIEGIESLQIRDSTTSFEKNSGFTDGLQTRKISGELSIRYSNRGKNTWIHAQVNPELVSKEHLDDTRSDEDSDTGTLTLTTDANDDKLVLDADNGKMKTVDITLTSAGIRSQFTQSWNSFSFGIPRNTLPISITTD